MTSATDHGDAAYGSTILAAGTAAKMAYLTTTGWAQGIPLHKSKIIALPQSRLSVQADVYKVPDGMRLTIEYVSFAYTASVHDDHAVQRLRIGTTVNGELVWHDVQTILGSSDWSGGSHLVTIYADPKSTVHAIVERVFRPRATSRVSISGRLEPIVPVPKATRRG